VATLLRVNSNIVVEWFESGAVALDLRHRLVSELDSRQSWLLRYADGERSLEILADDYAKVTSSTGEQALEILQFTYVDLMRMNILRKKINSAEGNYMDKIRYIINPDVNLREEDKDGALLYNPDLDRVQLLNSTGLCIWKSCAEGHTIDEIIAAIHEYFEETPENTVTNDVEEFLNQMIDTGFIGILE